MSLLERRESFQVLLERMPQAAESAGLSMERTGSPMDCIILGGSGWAKKDLLAEVTGKRKRNALDDFPNDSDGTGER